MKTPLNFQRKLLFLAVIFCAQLLCGQSQKNTDQSVEEDPPFVEARKLFWAGQYVEAEQKFKDYLLSHPKHEASKSFLQMIAQSRKFNPAKIDSTRKRLEEIHVDKLDFDQTDWKDAIQNLQDLANAKKDGKEPLEYINFITMVPSGYSAKATLSLRDVSLMKAIELFCLNTRLRFVIDTGAVIIDLPDSSKK